MDERKMLLQLSHLVAEGVSEQGDESLIIDTLAAFPCGINRIEFLQKINELFQIDIIEQRVTNAINRLLSNGSIILLDRKVMLSKVAMEQIKQKKAHNEEIEKKAVNEWFISFKDTVAHDLTQKDFALFSKLITNYLKKIFVRHGVNSYNLINGNGQDELLNHTEMAKIETASIKASYKKALEEFLAKIFSANRSLEQQEYLLTLINKAARYVSMVGDITVIEAVLSRLQGFTVYLDSSVIYRLLNLQGEERYRTIERIVRLCKENGMHVKIFLKTREELLRRISYDAAIIEKYQTPVNLAAVGYRARTSDNYISTFWKERSEKGVSAKDFNQRYANLATLLQEYGIDIDTINYCEDHKTAEFRDVLIPKIQRYFKADTEEDRKSDNAVQHDAECLASIWHLQNKDGDSVIDTKTIFMTTDWSLINMQNRDVELKSVSDLAMLPSQILQLMCFTKPNGDYCTVFLGLFSSSSAIFGTSQLDNSQIQEILGRIGMYSGITPRIAERILGNQLIQKTFSESQDNDEEEKNELISKLVIETAQSTEEDLKRIQSQYEEIQKQKKQDDAAYSDLTNEYERNRQELDAMRTANESQIVKIVALEESVEKKNNELRNVLISDCSHYGNRYKIIIRCVGVIIIAIGLITCLLGVLCFFPIRFRDEVCDMLNSLLNQQPTTTPINIMDLCGLLVAVGAAIVPGGGFLCGKSKNVGDFMKNRMLKKKGIRELDETAPRHFLST